ncbi:MAG: PAS domain-containing protein [Chthoniobacteraceae bacterium]
MLPQDISRVLLIEDSDEAADFLASLLKSPGGAAFSLAKHAVNLSEGLAAVESEFYEIILLDATLPEGGWLHTLPDLRRAAPQSAVLVLGEADDEELKILALREGAQDYLGKGGLDGRTFLRAVRCAVERCHALQTLLKEHEMFRALLDYLPDRIYFKDRQSRFTRVNPSMAQFFSLDRPEQLLGQTDFDFFTEEHARPAFEDEQKIMMHGRAIEGRIEKETLPDGRIGWASTTKMPLRDRRGAIVGTFGISHDITLIKEMEDALSAERTLLRNVINHLPDPIYFKDRQGRYQLDNQAHVQFIGKKSAQEIIGKTVFDFFPTEVAEHFHAADEVILNSGEALLNHEEVATDAAGNRRWLLTTKVPLRDDKDKIIGLVCIGRDITDQKEAEEKLVEANTNLRHTLNELKSAHEELHSVQLQLIEAEKMKTIGRLAAGVAHEVKNPLAIIMMGIAYLKDQKPPLGEQIISVLGDMSEATKRADNVIRGLLDFSVPKRLEASEESLNQVVEESLHLVRGEVDVSKHEIRKCLAPDLPLIKFDRIKIGQVLINLFTNSLQAMPEGGMLSVTTKLDQITGVGANIGDARSESFRAGDTIATVTVEDSGPGIPSDKLPKIFDPFFTTKPTGKGTGLGLTVSRSIMDLHGGLIQIANRPEGGTRAILTFRV